MFLYPISAIFTFQSSTVLLWQNVLTSISKQWEHSPVIEINDMNGDTVVDVRDLCIVVKKMKKEKTKIPTSLTLKNLLLFNHTFRTDKILLVLRNYSHQNNIIMTNICQCVEDDFKINMQVLKDVKLSICIKIPFLPLLC